MTIHKDHRRRVKNRFLGEGLDHFEELHALELLLFYAIPQGDVNPLAHRLLEHFGNLHQVLEAPPEQLMAVSGVGEHTAILLGLFKGISQKFLIGSWGKGCQLVTSKDCGDYLQMHYVGIRDEVVMLLCMDAKCKVLSCRIIGEGSINSAAVPTRRVVEAALAAKATSVVLAHNHPSGIALPSDEDVQTTCRIAAALSAVEIHLADHVVVAEG